MSLSWPRGFALVQFPNPPLITALLAALLGALTGGTIHRAALAVFYLALTIWAYEEARRGDNWFRRALGVCFLVYLTVTLARALDS